MVGLSIEDLDSRQMLMLYAVNKAPNGVPTEMHLQKIMYLTIKAMGQDPVKAVGYRAHYYGPFSSEVDGCRESLIDAGWLRKNAGEKVSIPDEVRDTVSRIKPADGFLDAKIGSIVDFICSMNTEEMLMYIYADDQKNNGGEMIENSDVRDSIFARRKEIAEGMMKKEKVSVGKGAELAGMEIRDFMDYMRQ
ncbi:hypothetical protein O8W32_02510 [Methanomassiliicoccales archaeon LGM-DZ1]|nr:hypothetical protein O8W32_02510 [Methanomassiliicoccales archaeon LGM-DZ1]